MPDNLFTFRTALGWCAILGRGDVLCGVAFGHRSPESASDRLAEFAGDVRLASWNRSLAKRITAALEGESTQFDDVAIDLSHLTPFGQRVIAACRGLGWGETASYRDLATVAGSPGAARAVGQVMAGNRTPLVVPCHRVIASGGKLGGFSAPQGIAFKRKLLDIESAVLCS